MYPKADANIQKMLESSFGGKEFFNQKITDRIQTWNDILFITGENANDYKLRPGETDDELAYRQAKLIALAYNEGKLLDAGNTNQNKYFSWHRIVKDASKPSGFGLSCDDYVNWLTYSNVGVRLCFFDPNNSVDAGKKFNEIYERLKIR